MILDQEKISRIKNLLKFKPKGMSISDISHSLKMNRNSVAKYLDLLLVSGQVEMQSYGTAKVYFLSQRVPLSAMLSLASDLVIILDSDFRIIQVNENFPFCVCNDKGCAYREAPYRCPSFICPPVTSR